MISASILKRLCDCLAVPFTIVVRRLFYEGCLPSAWKYHLICPIFKLGSAFVPAGYRGIHLTTVLSKVAEKIIGSHLLLFLQSKACGKDQWAFTSGLCSRDPVSMLMMSFALAVCTNKKIGAFLNDVSGAFDRVNKEILLSKLQGFGVRATCLRFLESYLASRVGNVAVQGKRLIDMIIDNSVFQGTVLGPALWNSFFPDIRVVAQSTSGHESMYADGLKVTGYNHFLRRHPLCSNVARMSTNGDGQTGSPSMRPKNM